MEHYQIVTWPEVQSYMDKEGFSENSYLISDENGMEDFGPSAYFVNSEWLNPNKVSAKAKIYIVSTLAESSDDTPTDSHKAFSDFDKAMEYKDKEVKKYMDDKDIDEGDVINNFQTLYEWRSDSEAVTVCVEEQELV